MRESFQYKIATIISTVFEPLIPISIVLLIAGMRGGLSFFTTMLWIFIVVLPPTLFRVWARRVYYLDWDIKDRKRRIVPLLVLIGFVAIDIALLSYFSITPIIQLFVMFFVWVVGFFLVTVAITKISGHTSGNALATGLLVQWFGLPWWPVLLIIPLVAWARVIRKDHTVTQVILGAFYSWGVLWVFSILNA